MQSIYKCKYCNICIYIAYCTSLFLLYYTGVHVFILLQYKILYFCNLHGIYGLPILLETLDLNNSAILYSNTPYWGYLTYNIFTKLLMHIILQSLSLTTILSILTLIMTVKVLHV